MDEIRTKAMGKIILFGEHSVVYGYTAIASPIEVHSYCTINGTLKQQNFFLLSDYNQYWEFYEQTDLHSMTPSIPPQYNYILQEIEKTHDKKIQNLQIDIKSDLWKGAGLGSSASTSTALIRALFRWYTIKETPETINKLTFEAERCVHGNPSGIDNTVITHEAPILFRQGKSTPISFSQPILMLLVHSGEPRQTKIAIQKVQQQKESDPPRVNQIFEHIENITNLGSKALKEGNLKDIGRLFNQNHKQLQELRLSTPKIEEIRKLLQNYGIFGSKLTGAGLGGVVIATGSPESLQKAQRTLQEAGFRNFLLSL